MNPGEMGLDRALELHRVDAEDPVQLVAPLDRAGGDVPHPPARVREASASLSRRSISARFACASCCSVMSRATRLTPSMPPSRPKTGLTDRHTGIIIPSLRLHLDVDVIDAVPGTDRADDRRRAGRGGVGEEHCDQTAAYFARVVAEDPLRAAVPGDDAIGHVETEHRV